MFTLQSPCSSARDLAAFTHWWGIASGKSARDIQSKIDALRAEIRAANEQIAIARQDASLLTKIRIACLGRVQEQLVPKRGQLLDLERAHPRDQPAMILSVPGVAGFWLNGRSLIFQTHCLYGRDYRIGLSPWCKIGRFEITLDPLSQVHQQNVLHAPVQWTNLDGGKCMGTGASPVPAPQVDANGQRGCMGDLAHQLMKDGLASGRIDTVIATIIRYTECPNPSTTKGDGMGYFPQVKDEDVPRFYREMFPR